MRQYSWINFPRTGWFWHWLSQNFQSWTSWPSYRNVFSVRKLPALSSGPPVLNFFHVRMAVSAELVPVTTGSVRSVQICPPSFSTLCSSPFQVCSWLLVIISVIKHLASFQVTDRMTESSFKVSVDREGLAAEVISPSSIPPWILYHKPPSSSNLTWETPTISFHTSHFREGDKWKTAFSTPCCHWEYLVMPFGLCNSSTVFQHFLNDMLRDMLGHWGFIYWDNILI